MVGCGVLDLGGRDADVAIDLRETLLFSGMDGKSNGFNVRLSLRMPVRRSEVVCFFPSCGSEWVIDYWLRGGEYAKLWRW